MTTTTAAPRRGARAIGAIGALAVGAGLVLAGPGVANAAPDSVTAGSLDWGLKQSWRDYAGKYQTLSGGTTLSPSGTYVFPAATGTVDGSSVQAAFTGSVNWTAHGGMMNITLSDLRIDIEGTSGELTADAVSSGTLIEDAQLAVLDLTGVTPTTTADGSSWSGIPAVGGSDLEAVFGSNYPAGTVLDPVGFTLETAGAGPVDPGPQEPAPGTATQELEVVVPQGGTDPGEPGSFAWQVSGDSSAVSLGQAALQDGRLVAAGQIKPVTVTDTRTTGSAWSVTAQVSDFTSDSGSTLPGRYLGWTPTAAGGGAQAGPTVTSGITAGPGLSQTAVLGSAPNGHAAGTTTLGAALDLQLPSSTTAGTYSATLTLTALS